MRRSTSPRVALVTRASSSASPWLTATASAGGLRYRRRSGAGLLDIQTSEVIRSRSRARPRSRSPECRRAAGDYGCDGSIATTGTPAALRGPSRPRADRQDRADGGEGGQGCGGGSATVPCRYSVATPASAAAAALASTCSRLARASAHDVLDRLHLFRGNADGLLVQAHAGRGQLDRDGPEDSCDRGQDDGRAEPQQE